MSTKRFASSLRDRSSSNADVSKNTNIWMSSVRLGPKVEVTDSHANTTRRGSMKTALPLLNLRKKLSLVSDFGENLLARTARSETIARIDVTRVPGRESSQERERRRCVSDCRSEKNLRMALRTIGGSYFSHDHKITGRSSARTLHSLSEHDELEDASSIFTDVFFDTAKVGDKVDVNHTRRENQTEGALVRKSYSVSRESVVQNRLPSISSVTNNFDVVNAFRRNLSENRSRDAKVMVIKEAALERLRAKHKIDDRLIARRTRNLKSALKCKVTKRYSNE